MKFYSETLDKIFDTEKDLKAAEKEAAEKEAAKKKASEEKRAEAKVVEDAYKAHNAAKRTYNENVLALRKQYDADLRALKKAFDEAVEAEAKTLDEAAVAFDTALKEFTDKHPEGYHMTLKDSDNICTLVSHGGTPVISNAFDRSFEIFNTLWNAFGF